MVNKSAKEWILCAAVKRKHKKELNSNPYYEGTNDILDIEIGFRHHDIYQRFKGELEEKNRSEGFYTSKGRFVDRYEGMKIAFEAGQVSKRVAFIKNIPDIEINITLSEDPRDDNDDSTFKDRGYSMLFSEDLY